MELIFLSEQDLSVLDYAYATDNYTLIFDTLVPQKSSFIVNKDSLNAEIGDLVHIRNKDVPYIGIIVSIEKNEDGTIKVQSKDYLSLFDIEVPVATAFEGNVAALIKQLIFLVYKNSSDAFQNIPYLDVSIEMYKNVRLDFEIDSKQNILNLVEQYSKSYGLRIEYEMVVHRGKFSGISIRLLQSTVGVVLRDNLGTITDLVINDTNEISLNKIIFIPKAENITYRSEIAYYLTNTGTVTKTQSFFRSKKVKVKYEYFSDKDYDALLTKASEALIDSSLQHSITFSFCFAANKIESLKALKCGVAVQFITKNKTYDSLVTKIEYKGHLNTAKVTLGEYRISLTDKLKLFDRRIK